MSEALTAPLAAVGEELIAEPDRDMYRWKQPRPRA
jgi:hypothetical protein